LGALRTQTKRRETRSKAESRRVQAAAESSSSEAGGLGTKILQDSVADDAGISRTRKILEPSSTMKRAGFWLGWGSEEGRKLVFAFDLAI